MRLTDRIDSSLRTGLGLPLLVLAILFYALLAIALVAVGSPPARVHPLYVSLGRLYLLVAGTRLLVAGADRIDRGTSYIVVANHESGWDPPCLLASLPDLPMRFVAGPEAMRLPLVGLALRMTGNVAVEPNQVGRNLDRLHEAMERRDAEVSIVFFAEGRHSPDGALHPFKLGAFAMALRYGLPVLPVAIAGTGAVWARDALRLKRGTVAVEVGTPIAIDHFPDADALRDHGFAAVAGLRAREYGRLPGAAVVSRGGR